MYREGANANGEGREETMQVEGEWIKKVTPEI